MLCLVEIDPVVLKNRNCKRFTDGPDKRWSKKLTWAFNLCELKEDKKKTSLGYSCRSAKDSFFHPKQLKVLLFKKKKHQVNINSPRCTLICANLIMHRLLNCSEISDPNTSCIIELFVFYDDYKRNEKSDVHVWLLSVWNYCLCNTYF